LGTSASPAPRLVDVPQQRDSRELRVEAPSQPCWTGQSSRAWRWRPTRPQRGNRLTCWRVACASP